MKMINLVETIDLNKNKKYESYTRTFSRNIIDLKKDQYTAPSNIREAIEEQWVNSGKHAKKVFSKIAAVVDLMKYTRTTEGCSILPIATTDKRLNSIFGTPKSVSRAIKKLINIQLIDVYCEQYHFTNDDLKKRGYSYSRTYYYFYETEQVLKDFLDEKKIQVYQWKNSKVKEEKINNLEKYIDPMSVKISSKLSINVDRNKQDFEKAILDILYTNYPQLKDYQEKADMINSTYYADKPDLQTVFIPHFTYQKGNKALTKIGIRATNRVVSAKKDSEMLNPEFKGLYKKDVLATYGVNEYDNSDVCASVPRLTKSISEGKWISQDIDIYEVIKNYYYRNTSMIASKGDFQFIFEKELKETEKAQLKNAALEMIDEVKTIEWKRYRKYFKSLFMRGYFDTPKKMGGHMKSIVMHDKTMKPKKNEIDLIAYVYRNAIQDAIGESLDSEIFLHESCIYMDVLEELLKRGHKVVQIYDSWYTEERVEDMEQIIEEKFQNYYNKYLKKEEENVLAGTLDVKEETSENAVKDSQGQTKTQTKEEEGEKEEIEEEGGNVIIRKGGRIIVRPKEDYERIEKAKKECRNDRRIVIRQGNDNSYTLVDSLGHSIDITEKLVKFARLVEACTYN